MTQNIIRGLGIIAVIIGSLSSNLYASDTLTFSECVARAFQNNIRIQQQQYNEQMYRLNIKRSKDARLPDVSGSLNGNLNWGRGIDPSTNTFVNQQFNNYNGSVNASLPLFNGFYHLNNIKLQKYDLEKNKSEIQKIKNDILIDLSMRYTNILYYQEQIATIENQIRLSQDNILQTQKRIDAGAIAKREIHRVIAQKESEELSYITAKNNLEQNLLELKIILNEDLSRMLDVKKVDVLSKLQSSPSNRTNAAPIYNNNVEHFPSFQISKIEYEKAKMRIKMAKSGFYPTITMGGNIFSAYSTLNRFHTFSEQLDNNRSMGISFNAQIPIFNRWQTRNNIEEATINLKLSELTIKSESQAASKTLLSAQNNILAAEKKYGVSLSSLKSNQSNYEADKIRLDAGRINLQELNISKSNYFNAQINLIKDKYEWMYHALVLSIYQGIDLKDWLE